MRKERVINAKIGIVIALFSIVATSSFIGMFLVFSKVEINSFVENNSDTIYILNEDDIYNITLSGTILVGIDQLYSMTNYNKNYTEVLLKQLVPYAIGFCFFLFLLSIILWIVINKIQSKNNLKIIEQLENIENIESFESDNQSFISAYESIKNKFENNLNDYKRLNSYLSHEQKNTIAILKTEIEISGHTQYIANLDMMANSIDDILTLSESAEMSINETVDIMLVCATVCDTYKDIQKNIILEFDENDDTEIIAKQRWIYRAVSNLLSNAIKYGNNKPIKVCVYCKNGSVILSVQDKGIGIAPCEQKKIFNNRYRINDLHKDGYGIGLSLVSHVCDLCGGFIMVESAVNAGSTFYLSFPQKNRQINIQ